MSDESDRAAKPLATVLSLAASAYVSNGLRAFSAILLRLVLDPVAVGLINSLQVFATLLGPVTLGSIYGALRAIPAAVPEERILLARSAFAGAVIEAAIVCTLAIPLSLTFLDEQWRSPGIFLGAAVYVFVYRLLSIQESLLLAYQSFDAVVRTRLLRTLEQFGGAAAALVHATATTYIIVSTLVAACGLALRRRVFFSFECGARRYFANGWRTITETDSYSFRISLDRMFLTVANYIDPLVVALVAGPGSLAGYYLGINIRGLLLNLPSAVFWQRWAGSVKAFDAHGIDRFTNVWFLGRLWLIVCALLAVAMFFLWIAVETILRDYRSHLREVAVAAMVAIPITLSVMLRGRRMLDRKVGRLVALSCVRLAVFGLGLFIASDWGHRTLAVPAIALLAYSAAAVECLINAVDVSRLDRRWRLAAVTAAMVLMPGALALWLVMP